MSKGIGKLQRDILDYLESDQANEYPVDTAWIAFRLRRWVKPGQTIVKGQIEDPSPEKLAAYHARMQSIRRALRGLQERGLVVKFRPLEGDRRESTWMATSAYKASSLYEALEG